MLKPSFFNLCFCELIRHFVFFYLNFLTCFGFNFLPVIALFSYVLLLKTDVKVFSENDSSRSLGAINIFFRNNSHKQRV